MTAPTTPAHPYRGANPPGCACGPAGDAPEPCRSCGEPVCPGCHFDHAEHAGSDCFSAWFCPALARMGR